jgi:hypothetical protein
MGTSKSIQVPINVRGSSSFGIYPKISLEKTYNMFESDEWMISYAGYQLRSKIAEGGTGRALFRSIRGGFMVSVIGQNVYTYNTALTPTLRGVISTTSGEVYIDENLAGQISIVDGEKIYILNYTKASGVPQFDEMLPNATHPNALYQNDGTTPISITELIPGHVTYHNTYFLIASSPNSPNPQSWYVFIKNTICVIRKYYYNIFKI